MKPLIVYDTYSATGEGLTVSVLVTRAYPRGEDYIKSDDYSDIRTINTPEERALREFQDHFGYFGQYGQLVELEKVKKYLPEFVVKMIEEGGAGNIHYYAQFHVNYS